MFKYRDSFWERKVLETVCGYIEWFCEYVSTFVASNNLKYDNDHAFQVYIGHYPSTTSTKSFLHLGQMMRADTFQEYDYGTEENLKRYGQEGPILIDLSHYKNLNLPTAIFAGKFDELAVPTDC